MEHEKMTDKELYEYVKSHRNDTNAWEAFRMRMHERPSITLPPGDNTPLSRVWEALHSLKSQSEESH